MSALQRFSGNDFLIISSFSLIGIAFIAFSFLFGLEGINGLIILGIILALFMSYILVKFEKFWIYSLIAILPFYFYGSSEGITVNDIFMSLYLNSFTFLWLIYIIFIKREKIVDSISDYLILLYYIFSVIAVIISLSNDITFIDWIKEYALFSVFLIYFPLKYYLKEKKDIIRLLIILGVAIFCSDLYHFYLYKTTALQEALYAYQLGISVRWNQTIFTTASFSGLILAIYAKTLRMKTILLIFTFITTLALTVTFSRTFWVILLVLSSFAFFFLPVKKKRVLLTIVSVVISLAFLIAILVFKENTEFFLKVAEKRFTSVGNAKKDESLLSRIGEFESAFSDVMKSPLSGMGLGAKVRVFDYFKLTTKYNANIHNSYIFTLHRWGFAFAIIWYFIVLYNTFFAFNGIIRSKDEFHKILSFIAFAGLFTLLVASTTSSQFYQRDGQVVFGLSLFFVSKINKELKWISKKSENMS